MDREKNMAGNQVQRKIPLFTVDAFTSEPFSGNPAAVCLLDSEMMLSDEERQNIGAEMNISETAFVVPQDSKDFCSCSKFTLRWFTPTNEVDLCGHATLASSAVLFNEMGNNNDELEFSSRSGPLYVRRSDDKISLNFPLNPPSPKILDDSLKPLLKIILEDLDIIQEIQLSKTKKLVIRLKDGVTRETLQNLRPKIGDFVKSYNAGDISGVGVTIRGSEENGCVDREGRVYDFVSRYFAPWLGIPEDPVTGAWHTVVSAYWSKELGKSDLYARQCSKRGGEMWIKVDNQRVTLAGQAVVNMKGTFFL